MAQLVLKEWFDRARAATVLAASEAVAQKAEEMRTTLAVATRKQEVALAQAAVKAEEVKTALVVATDKQNTAASQREDKLDRIEKTTESVHTLVNSNMGVALKVSMVALRRVADLTGHADDRAAADLAEKAFSAHEAKQAIVDSGKVEPIIPDTKAP